MMLSLQGHTAVAAPAEGMPEQPDRAVAADIARLKATVIDGGYCIGCGACAGVPGSPIRMAMDGVGRLQATATLCQATPTSTPQGTCHLDCR